MFTEPARSIRGQLAPDERIVLHTRAHLARLIGRIPRLLGVSILNGVVTSAVLLCAVASYPLYFMDVRDPALLQVAVILWIVGVPSGYAMVLIARWLRTHYVFTDHRVIQAEGIVDRDTQSLPLARITNISYRQGTLDRILGSGDLVIESDDRARPIVLQRLPRIKQTHSELLTLLPHRAAHPREAPLPEAQPPA